MILTQFSDYKDDMFTLEVEKQQWGESSSLSNNIHEKEIFHSVTQGIKR